MRKTFVVFIAFIMLYVVVDQYDTWMSYNEIKQYYTDNYTFIYKQKTLSKSLTKQFLQQLKGQSHIHGSKDKDMVLHQFNKTLEMINMLVQKAKNGVKPFSEATLENMDNYIFYDEKAETENGFPIVHGMMVDEDHHDVLSTLDQYINSEDEYTVRVRFDEDDYMYIEFQLDDGIIEIDENGWYVA